jgi:hypothetical protein
MALKIDKEKTRKNIAFILERLKTDVDADLLNEYRAVFRKEISLSRRSWVAAYLLMQLEQGDSERAGRSRKPQRETRYAGKQAEAAGKAHERRGENRDEPRQYPLAEEDSIRLFINIGRSRRVFPREILGFINAKVGTPREDIGSIRILDNYSFIQVRTTIADSIIEGLNGQSFRGKIISISYAKNRKDEDGENSSQDESDNGRAYTETTVNGSAYPETGRDYSEESDTGFSEQEQDQPDKEDI